jgi:HSP20 family molecular chaperone IbpA
MSRTESIRIQKQGSLGGEIEDLNDRITKRAYEIFERRGRILGFDLDDWLMAEKELVWKPSVELTEKGDELVVVAALSGVDPKHIQIEATPEDLIIKGETAPSESHSALLWSSVHFPKRVRADHIKARYKDGVLRIHAPISKEERSAGQIQAAAS